MSIRQPKPVSTSRTAIRLAVRADARAIAEAHAASWQSAYRDLMPASVLANLSISQREDNWRKFLDEPRATLLVAEVAGEVVGMLALAPTHDEDAAPSTLEILALYVVPQQQRRGIGRALLAACVSVAARSGATSLMLWTLERNQSARRFYTRCGFRGDRSTRRAYARQGIELFQLRYVLDSLPSMVEHDRTSFSDFF